jgi:hypothetical protein
MNMRVPFLIEWLSTIVLLVGVALTAYNIYPLGIWISFIGNLGWLVIGYMWRKWSLITIQIIISTIYFSGLINYYGVLS